MAMAIAMAPKSLWSRPAHQGGLRFGRRRRFAGGRKRLLRRRLDGLSGIYR